MHRLFYMLHLFKMNYPTINNYFLFPIIRFLIHILTFNYDMYGQKIGVECNTKSIWRQVLGRPLRLVHQRTQGHKVKGQGNMYRQTLLYDSRWRRLYDLTELIDIHFQYDYLQVGSLSFMLDFRWATTRYFGPRLYPFFHVASIFSCCH